MRYERAKLVGRNWHKVVFDAPYSQFGNAPHLLKPKVESALKRLTGDYMNKNMGYHYVVMVDTEDDLIMLKMMTGFTDEEYRGHGDWSQVKYSSKEGNRISRKS